MKRTALILILLFNIAYGYTQVADSATAIPDKKVAPWWVERFKLSAAFFYPVNDITVQVGLNGAVEGTEIDFKKDLGFNSGGSTFLANFQWRVSRRSRINFAYFSMDRSSTHTLDKDIIFDDTTYHANATVKSFFKTAVYQFSYGYAFVQKPKFELGVLIGAHTVNAKTGIALSGNNADTSTSNDFGFTAPLPDLGIWGGYAISDRFAVNMDFDYLSLTINDIKGSIIAYNLAFSYQLLKQLDLSLGYTGLNFKVETTKDDVSGKLKWGYNGPTLAATFVFGKKTWTH